MYTITSQTLLLRGSRNLDETVYQENMQRYVRVCVCVYVNCTGNAFPGSALPFRPPFAKQTANEEFSCKRGQKNPIENFLFALLDFCLK